MGYLKIPDSMGPKFGDQNPIETGTEAKNFETRIARYGTAKTRSVDMYRYIEGVVRHEIEELRLPWLDSISCAIRDCGSYLVFKDYYTVGEVRLSGASFCRRHLICPFCAIRRGSKLVKSYDEKYKNIVRDRSNPQLELVTLTVKNGDNLIERFTHLVESYRKLISKRKKGIQRGTGGGEFVKISGGVYSIEFTNRGNGWHPHIHILALMNPGQQISQSALSEEWQKNTQDSYIVDSRPVDDPINGFMEVFKYALKFSDLSLEQNWQAFDSLFGRRLVGAFGDFYGVSIDDDYLDESLDDLPYLERFFNYAGNGSYLLRAS